MPRPTFPGASARLVQNVRWRRIAAGLGVVAAAALGIGIVISAGLPGSSKGAGTPAKASGSTTVQRRDLVATDTESGTLSYADSQTVYNRVTGTVTWLPTIGQTVSFGQTLYKVDNAPVILFNGDVPAYRSLSEGVSDGPDVKELEQNLRALGYDPNHDMTIDDTFDWATAAAVERWQAALGETQTGTVTLGQVVFLPGTQRITAVDTVLGSNGSSAGAGSGSGTGSSARTTPAPARPVFVDLTTTSTTTTSCPATPTTSSITTSCPTTTSSSTTSTTSTTTATTPPPSPGGPGSHSGKPGGSKPSTLAALLALLKAETLELKKGGSSGTGGGGAGTGAAGAGGGRAGGGGAGGGGGGGGGGAGGGGTAAAAGAGSGGSGGSGSSGSGSGAGSAQAILGTTSTQLVVTVDLDATKQSEAVVGEPVTVELPDGTTVDGRITEVSPVAQSSSSSSSSAAAGGGGGGSNQPSATIPVTITLKGRKPKSGLDQAAVSVNFEQQKARNVLSVPVTALLATAGGGYAVQQAAPPHRLIPVTPGLFAAGYVQVSGSGIYEGLQITDSQG